MYGLGDLNGDALEYLRSEWPQFKNFANVFQQLRNTLGDAQVKGVPVSRIVSVRNQITDVENHYKEIRAKILVAKDGFVLGTVTSTTPDAVATGIKQIVSGVTVLQDTVEQIVQQIPPPPEGPPGVTDNLATTARWVGIAVLAYVGWRLVSNVHPDRS